MNAQENQQGCCTQECQGTSKSGVYRVTETFSSPTELKEKLVDDFKDKLPGETDISLSRKFVLKMYTLSKRETLSAEVIKLLI